MGGSPHRGQPHPHPSLVPTHEPRSWPSRKSSRRRFPTWANSDRKRPVRQRLRNQPGEDPHCGQPRRHPSWAHTHENPRRNHPAGRDLPTRGHIGRGDSSNDDAYCGTKVEYRTSSTPAYTDRLDLHYSTNNAPTKTWGRARLRIADNPRCTHDWCAPTNSAPGPHSALRTTTTAPIIGAHPRKPGVQLRIADNCACTNNRCPPTNHVAGGLVKVDTKRAISHLGKQSPKTTRSSTFAKAAPANSALRTTPGAPTMGNTHKSLYR